MYYKCQPSYVQLALTLIYFGVGLIAKKIFPLSKNCHIASLFVCTPKIFLWLYSSLNIMLSSICHFQIAQPPSWGFICYISTFSVGTACSSVLLLCQYHHDCVLLFVFVCISSFWSWCRCSALLLWKPPALPVPSWFMIVFSWSRDRLVIWGFFCLAH